MLFYDHYADFSFAASKLRTADLALGPKTYRTRSFTSSLLNAFHPSPESHNPDFSANASSVNTSSSYTWDACSASVNWVSTSASAPYRTPSGTLAKWHKPETPSIATRDCPFTARDGKY
jgi:hypothetical protein